jgi:hypothetical protein
MNVSQYILRDLFDPNDKRFWRLHWFEQLTMNQQTTEPLQEVLPNPLQGLFILPDQDLRQLEPEPTLVN